MRQGSLYTLFFAAAVCGVFSVAVSLSAVSLKDRQERNKVLDRQKNVLAVAGLAEPGQDLSADAVEKLFADNIETRVVNLETGDYAEGLDPATYDPRKALADPGLSRDAPENAAKVQRLPLNALVYLVRKEGSLDAVILPVEGKGLWSTLYGYLALDRDLRTVKGITFYEHAETPGLGGEVDNPKWKALWVGRKAFGDDGAPKIEVIKGTAGPADSDPYRIDGLSGATLTARGVSHLVRFWLGDEGYRPYLEKLKITAGS